MQAVRHVDRLHLLDAARKVIAPDKQLTNLPNGSVVNR